MEDVTLIKEALLLVAELLGAATIVFGALFAIYRWILKQNKQDADIAALKEEQTLICYGVLAALQGLKEKGCNGPVTEAINKIDKYLNVKAHQ